MEEGLGSKVGCACHKDSRELSVMAITSRRPPPKEMMNLLTEDQRSRVEHVACDFLSEPEDIAKQLQEKDVTADYVFFCKKCFQIILKRVY